MAGQTERKRRPRPPDPKLPPGHENRQMRSESLDALILSCLLAGKTIVATVELLGIGRAAVDRRLADPAFRQTLEESRTDMLRAVMDRIGSEAMSSLETLAAIRDNPEATWASRVRAADRILRFAFGTPIVEVNQTTIIGGHAGPDPAEQLRAFLGKLQQRGETMAQALSAAPIDVESTET